MRQISYKCWCFCGGAKNKRLFSKAVYVGKCYYHHTYWDKGEGELSSLSFISETSPFKAVRRNNQFC